MTIHKKDVSPGALCAILDYISAELEDAQTADELAQIMELAKILLLAPSTRNMVLGLPNIRAQMEAPTQSKKACTVHLEVPTILSDAFQDLSWRMSALQDQDQETFSNAANALRWLAKGETTTN